jgi:electron transfer flavoprotein beta subunit
MKILVVLRQVPDSTTTIKIRPDATDIERAGVKLVLNPFDEFAIEAAVRLRESRKDVQTITGLIVWPNDSVDALRTALAIGADEGIQLKDAAFDKLDQIQLAALMAAVVHAANYDLVIVGKQEIDLDSGELGPALAEFLDLPHVGAITKLEVAADGKSLVANRRIEGAEEVVQTPLPALVTAEKGLGDARYPSLPNLMKAKKKPVKMLAAQDVPGWPTLVQSVGGAALMSMAPPPQRPPGKVLKGEPEQTIPALVRLLREEAKVI